MKRIDWQLWLFPLLTLVLLVSICFQNQAALSNKESLTYTYLRQAVQGRLGYGAVGNYGNMISFHDLEPGDILLGVIPGVLTAGSPMPAFMWVKDRL